MGHSEKGPKKDSKIVVKTQEATGVGICEVQEEVSYALATNVVVEQERTSGFQKAEARNERPE